MAIDLDDEILQDFLVEAGEILELLGEQLVELEQSPNDPDLLNAIFRGFHTIKGGAGFLALESLVTVCHKAEDVFDVLREGERQVTSNLMDVILEVVDIVNVMFEQVKTGVEPEAADDDLLTRLQAFTRAGGGAEETVEQAPETTQDEEGDAPGSTATDVVEQEFGSMLDDTSTAPDNTEAADDEITEQEFDNLLDELHGKGQFSANSLPSEEGNQEKPQSADTGSDEITEEEFDGLLDELHGKGQFSSQNLKDEKAVDSQTDKDSGDISEEEFDGLLDDLHGKGQFSAKKLQEPTEPSSQANDESTEITENEFDDLLDDLHGKGKFSGSVAQSDGVPAEKNSDGVKEKQVEKVEQKPKPSKSEKKTKPAKAENKEKPVETNAAPAAKQSPKATSSAANQKPKAAAQGETTVRVDTYILDEIMNMVGELVLVRNRFQTLKAASETVSSEELTKAVSNLDVVTADLQLAVMKTRMQPIKKVFGRFPRVVRDLSRSLKKEIKLDLVGEETDLDKNLVEALADPLVHLIRNAVDHGIESPEDREVNGKPREGRVVLTASQEGDHILLSIEDDGKGMNADKLRSTVVEKGLMDEEAAARLDNKECYNLIFMPGFSTKAEISDVSGRGVGMDVVKTRISQMNGVVEIDSNEGTGSTIIIKVPLTLAIMPTLMVVIGGQAFALPLASVLEILDLDLRTTNIVDGQLVVMVREKALPVFYLSEWLVNKSNTTPDEKAFGHVVVVNSGGKSVGFVVDQLIGQEEVVIKPLGAKLQGLDGLAGATITGDGKIALILDVPGLMHRYAS